MRLADPIECSGLAPPELEGRERELLVPEVTEDDVRDASSDSPSLEVAGLAELCRDLEERLELAVVRPLLREEAATGAVAAASLKSE